MAAIRLSQFKNNNRRPFDRELFCKSANGANVHFLTLGAASYILGGNFELRSNFTKSLVPHTMIGRFCNLSWDIKFLAGFNHPYKNSVSLYAFYSMSTLRKIASRIEDKENLELKPCKNKLSHNNHYQIIVGSDVWIGRGVTILGGVKIGSGAIIGANSTITKDVPPYAVVAGNPAKIIKYRFDPETIKKFMAIKWWNWDTKKILQNAYLMDDVEKFLEKHYSPELENIPEKNFGGVNLKDLRTTGRKIYSFVGDFSAPLPLWKRVLDGFFKSTSSGDILVFWVDEGSASEKIDELKNFLNGRELTDGKIIYGFTPKDGKIFSPYILRNSTHFITTREMISLECMDWLWDTDVKIVSALDDGIFDGEPIVDWNKIFSK